jgi:hypothetical protein
MRGTDSADSRENRVISARADGAWRLEARQLVRRPLAEVWPFFERPENLQAITPGWLSFQILTPSPVSMHEGAVIDYRLRLFGLPVAWRTRITRHEPGVAFVDEQERGPFALWRHLHEFHAHPAGTLVLDRVDHRPPLGALGTLAELVFVQRLVERTFRFRQERIAALLEGPASPAQAAWPAAC